jgi:hypothetical protein
LRQIAGSADNINYNVNYTIALKFKDRKSEKRRLKVFSRIHLSPASPIMLIIVAVVVIIVLPFILALLLLQSLSYAQQQGENAATNTASCITYDSIDNIITISCDSSLTDIDNQLNDDTILDKEQPQQSDNGVWLLNAGIIVGEDAHLLY